MRLRTLLIILRTCVVPLAVAVAVVLNSCGLQASESPEIDSILQEAVDRGDVPGVVAMAATSKRIVYQGAFGKRFAEANEDMTLDSIFRIASMTKPVTSVAAMRLVEEGVLSLETEVSQHIPNFANLQILVGIDTTSRELDLRPATKQVTLKHLLTHRAGFGYEFWNPLLRDSVAADRLPSIMKEGDGFLQAPLICEPGERWCYGINTDWLGRLVETVRGQPLNEVLGAHLFRPLHMRDTDFDLPATKVPRLVTVHTRQSDGSLKEKTRANPAPVFFYSGGGGLFSTAPDYTRFLRALLRRGELDGVHILQADTVALMGRNHIGELEAGRMCTVMPEFSNNFDFFPGSSNGFGLGFLINSEPIPGGRAAGSLAWAGIFNTYFWLDCKQDVCGVLMTQVLPFYDARVVKLFKEFELAVYKRVGN